MALFRAELWNKDTRESYPPEKEEGYSDIADDVLPGGGILMVDVANIHLPVLFDDCVNLMAPALEHENAIAVDCTLGLAGHSIAFLKAAPQARLIGLTP